MNKYTRAIVSGFVATVVLSILMVIKAKMGMLPGLNVIHMLGGMVHAGLLSGWVAHFLIGTVVWGVLFALLFELLPGRSAITKGIVFSIGAWLMMMIIVMPMAGAGLFGMGMGMMAPVMTLVLHLIWGVVLGGTYQILPTTNQAMA